MSEEYVRNLANELQVPYFRLCGRSQNECVLCKNGHGGVVCDCGGRHDEHVFAAGRHWWAPHPSGHGEVRKVCDGYSQRLLNRRPGVDVRKEPA